NVGVSSSITETYQEISQSSVTKPSGSSGQAVALAVAVGYFDNDSEASISGTSTVDASGTVSVTSTLSYPFLTNPIEYFTSIPGDFTSLNVSALTTLFDGTLGISSNLLNTWVIAGAKASDSTATSVSGSVGINIFTNT